MGCSFSCDAKNAATPGTSQDRHARPQRPVEQSPSGNPLCLHRGTHDDFACGVGPVSGSPTGQSLPFIVADAVVDRRSGGGGAAAAATRASATAIRTSQVLRFRPRPHPRAAHVAVPEVDDAEYGPHRAGAGVTSESAVTGGSFSSHASVGSSWEPSGSADLTSPLETVIQLMPEFEAF